MVSVIEAVVLGLTIRIFVMRASYLPMHYVQ